jgi:hypothetical protein
MFCVRSDTSMGILKNLTIYFEALTVSQNKIELIKIFSCAKNILTFCFLQYIYRNISYL